MDIGSENVLLIDKPKGVSSAAVLNRLKKLLGVKKAGHAGTLDPLATGLLVVGINEGTKKLSALLKQDKVYEADILLGVTTDTGDVTGTITASTPLSIAPNEATIQRAIQSLVGDHELFVPLYSAIKQRGTPLYTYARSGRGDQVVIPKRVMRVYNAHYRGTRAEHNQYIVTVQFSVGSGVYIRSLVEEFGRRVGLPATLQDLRRTQIGLYDVKNACTLDTFSKGLPHIDKN